MRIPWRPSQATWTCWLSWHALCSFAQGEGKAMRRKEAVTMNRVRRMLWTLSLVTGLGIGLAGLLHPVSAQAGDLHLSIGFGLPVPAEVVPAPVVVAPPLVVVQPTPVLTYPPPVVVVEPYRVWS